MPFKLRLLPRFESIERRIKQEAEEARLQLRAYDAETSVTFESAQLISLDTPISRAEIAPSV